MTSNFHNLAHLVDEVSKFGVLQSISAYPFENLLGYMKRLVRCGRNPLSQIARRMSELAKINNSNKDIFAETTPLVLTKPNNGIDVPAHFHLVCDERNEFYLKVDFGNFS